MPNHIKNIITYEGDEKKIKEMLEKIKYDQLGIGTIDFNKIIPRSPDLDIEAGSKTDKGFAAYQDFIFVYTLGGTVEKDLDNISVKAEEIFLKQRTDIDSESWELGRKAFHNFRLYGAKDWYDWSCKNWGTKWNAYDYMEGTDYSQNDDLQFETAWSAPHPVIEKLSQMFPEIAFEHKWADEDISVNCGYREYKNGELVSEQYYEGGKEAMEFAASVWNIDLADSGLRLNAANTDYVNVDGDDYELIEIFDKPALFANERLTNENIPEGLHLYYLRESDDMDRFASIEKDVKVNLGGTVITSEPIDLGENGIIELNEETTPNFTGQEITMQEYLDGDFENQAESSGTELNL